MLNTSRWSARVGAAICLAAALATAEARQQKDEEKDTKGQDSRRPRFSLRAQPTVGISPTRVVLTGELVGGANDYEEYYCPTVEWDWGDETKSESSVDCEPYEAGKSEIKRRFTVQHVFSRPGMFKVSLRLKRKDKVLAFATVSILVQPGAGPS